MPRSTMFYKSSIALSAVLVLHAYFVYLLGVLLLHVPVHLRKGAQHIRVEGIHLRGGLRSCVPFQRCIDVHV